MDIHQAPIRIGSKVKVCMEGSHGPKEEDEDAYLDGIEGEVIGYEQMIKFTSIVLVIDGSVHSVNAHRGWMKEEDEDAYLDGIEGDMPEGMNIVFNRITLYADIGSTDGGWTSVHRRNGRWDISRGGDCDISKED